MNYVGRLPKGVPPMRRDRWIEITTPLDKYGHHDVWPPHQLVVEATANLFNWVGRERYTWWLKVCNRAGDVVLEREYPERAF
jgi:hypothetical protein